MAKLIYLVPGAILGAIISYILRSIGGGFQYVIWMLRHKRPAEGIWYSYHCTRQSHQPGVRQMRWSMRQNLRVYYTAICWGDDIDSTRRLPPTNQRGTAFPERGHRIAAKIKHLSTLGVQDLGVSKINEKSATTLRARQAEPARTVDLISSAHTGGHLSERAWPRQPPSVAAEW